MEKKDIKITSRPPIVAVLGHVDHGKTTLLDAMRKTDVASGEAGGITQSIGASVVTTKDGKKITFIDTPGHAAFTKMRSRGARVADIAILVVAQDDGVKPQTLEALKIIKEAGIPFVVAGTKADVAGANAEALKGELEKEQVFFEGRGGDVPFVSVSAKTGQGIDELLETLSLMAEVADIKGDPSANLEAVIIESGKNKTGVVATAVIRNGSLSVGDDVYAEQIPCRVRALFDDKNSSVKKVLPGDPVRIFGFSDIPTVGATVASDPHEAKKEEAASKNPFDLRRLADDEVPVIIKASNAGALEAIVASVPPKIIVVGSGVGDVTSSDILDAKTGNAYVLAFETKIPNNIVKLADAEKVNAKRFDIIYELIQYLEEILKNGKDTVLGKAEVLASFPFDNKRVAGCKVTEGKVTRGDNLILIKEGKEIGRAKAASLKKQKTEVSTVGNGEEFGVIMDPQLDFNTGDVIVSVRNGK